MLFGFTHNIEKTRGIITNLLTKQVLQNGLGLLGVSAPEKM
jgi:arginyl-tRNA synthetase